MVTDGPTATKRPDFGEIVDTLNILSEQLREQVLINGALVNSIKDYRESSPQCGEGSPALPTNGFVEIVLEKLNDIRMSVNQLLYINKNFKRIIGE